MTVVESIVTQRRIEADKAELELLVPADLEYFRGHFSGAPVVPGVVQIKWALDFAARYLGVNGAFAGMEALKFQQVMRPGARVTLLLHYAAPAHKLHFSYQYEQARYSSGRLLLRPMS